MHFEIRMPTVFRSPVHKSLKFASCPGVVACATGWRWVGAVRSEQSLLKPPASPTPYSEFTIFLWEFGEGSQALGALCRQSSCCPQTPSQPCPRLPPLALLPVPCTLLTATREKPAWHWGPSTTEDKEIQLFLKQNKKLPKQFNIKLLSIFPQFDGN